MATSTPWVASAAARMAPATARHQGWATRGRKAPHGRLFHGVATVAATESTVAEGGAAAAAVEAVLLAYLLRDRGVGLTIW